ncbi:WbqC family protein [Roseivirga sp.]|uniref:WbqC family protein n=1 Tax=Roseivirga sp. TaxID=1964215 RepID=UPI003B8DE4A8
MKVVITQSNYIPWKGYFDSISIADYFVVFDEMQYTRRDWRNRNKIKTINGLQWLTVPVDVKGKFFQKINETKIADKNWVEKHWKSLVHNYSKAPYFEDYKILVNEWYREAFHCDTITDVNMVFLKGIGEFLGVKAKFLFSRDFNLVDDKTERLVAICQELNGTDYYTGSAAKAYMQEDFFKKQSINVHYFDYSGYPEYKQLHGDFEHGVSILDMIFNLGPDCKNYMKSIK